jgi:hypothetical protein
MAKSPAHKWEFARRFRRQAFGWRSRPAIQRVKEAVSEIKQMARRNPLLAAEGAVLFLEKVSPALEQVDSSSGAIGTAVNRAIAELVAIIASAPADAATREAWLERLWQAHAEDQIPYIERLADSWGELCASAEVASGWADRLKPLVELSWAPEQGGYFHGTMACFGALLRAGRHAEVLALVQKAPFVWWPYRQWGVRALVALGQHDEAVRYAEASRGRNDDPLAIARACEEILLSMDRSDEAYERYAIPANWGTTYLATYRAIARKYPHRPPAQILDHLVASTPGEEGKWFVAAREAGLYDEAIALAKRSGFRRHQTHLCDRDRVGRARLARRGIRLRDHGRGRGGRLQRHGQGRPQHRMPGRDPRAHRGARRGRSTAQRLHRACPFT